MSLGQRIRQLRQSRGLTQAQLAGQELTKSFISLMERDLTQPSVKSLVRVASSLGVSIDSLLGSAEHVPDQAAGGLLTLSADAIRRRNFAAASQLLAAANFLSRTYGLEEPAREVLLQEAQIALEARGDAKPWAKLVEAKEASERVNDPWRTGRALVLMGWAKLRQREFTQAASLLQESLVMLRRAKAGRDPARIEALIALGSTLVYLGEFSSAIQRYEEAANSQVAQRDPALRGRALWGLGFAHRKKGKYEVAAHFLLKAKDAFESAEELPDLVRVLHNLGQVLYEQAKHKDALEHFHHALRVMDNLKMEVARAATLTEIGRTHLALDDLEEAQHFAQSAFQAAGQAGDPVEIAEAQVVLARVYYRQKDSPSAIKLLKDALTAFRERGMQAKTVETAKELALLLREHGAGDEAADYLTVALEETTRELKAMKSEANLL